MGLLMLKDVSILVKIILNLLLFSNNKILSYLGIDTRPGDRISITHSKVESTALNLPSLYLTRKKLHHQQQQKTIHTPMTSFYKKKKIRFPVPWLSAKVFNHECIYRVKKVSNNMQVIQNRLTNT